MTPKEKANELVDKFIQTNGNAFFAKECALIAVDNILNNFGSLTDGKSHYCDYATIKYYEQVKEEIQKL